MPAVSASRRAVVRIAASGRASTGSACTSRATAPSMTAGGEPDVGT